MSYSVATLGQPPPPPPGTAAATRSEAELPSDVAPTLAHETVQPLSRQRGWVAVPTYDVRQYVQAQLLTALAGFTIGVGIGATLGNVLGGSKIEKAVTKVVRNRRRRRSRRNSRRRTSRRTSARRRRRGRPAGGPAHEPGMTVTIDRVEYEVDVIRGNVIINDVRVGSVYDLGTSFRAIPATGGDVRSYGTLAGAVKHVLRQAMAA